MKKLTLMSVLAVLCLFNNRGTAQTYRGPEFIEGRIYVGTRFPDFSLGTFINYHNTNAKLSDFNNKLIIFDFWFTGCPVCIKQFSKLDSLQKLYGEYIQIIPVTYQPKKVVNAFLENWKKINGRDIHLPFIVGDTLLTKCFPNIYYPFSVWIAQDRRMIGTTSAYFLTAENIEGMLMKTRRLREDVRKDTNFFKNDLHLDLKYLYNPIQN